MIAFYQAVCVCVCVCLRCRVSTYIGCIQHCITIAVCWMRCSRHRRCVLYFARVFLYLFYFNLFFIIIVISTKSNTTNVLAWAWTNTLINTSSGCVRICSSILLVHEVWLALKATQTHSLRCAFKRWPLFFSSASADRCCCCCAFDLVDYLHFKCMSWFERQNHQNVECGMHYEWACSMQQKNKCAHTHTRRDNILPLSTRHSIWAVHFLHMQWASQLAHACLLTYSIRSQSFTLKRMHSVFMYLFIWNCLISRIL